MQENEQIKQIKNWVEQIKTMQNPQYGMEMLMKQNPQIQQTVELVNSMGVSPKQAFIQLAKMKGVSPEQIINMLK